MLCIINTYISRDEFAKWLSKFILLPLGLPISIFNLFFYHISKDSCLTEIRIIPFFFVCLFDHIYTASDLSPRQVMLMSTEVFASGQVLMFFSHWAICTVQARCSPEPVHAPCSCLLQHQAGTVSSSVCSVQGRSQHRKMLPKVINFWWR